LCSLDAEKKKSLTEAVTELDEARKPYENDRTRLLAELDSFRKQFGQNLPVTNEKQQAARKAFDPIAEHMKDLVKQVDLLYKLSARTTDLCSELPRREGRGEGEDLFDARGARRLLKQLDEERKATVEQLKQTTYFHRQIAWLQDRFPKAELEAVPGLVKLVDRKDIEAADWSLTPGRYVGVAPPKEDEDFDFEAVLQDIHTELNDLNKEAVELAAKIQTNFEELA
jgi:type I restriction enzyme M protein